MGRGNVHIGIWMVFPEIKAEWLVAVVMAATKEQVEITTVGRTFRGTSFRSSSWLPEKI